jgi:hypothetical protein
MCDRNPFAFQYPIHLLMSSFSRALNSFIVGLLASATFVANVANPNASFPSTARRPSATFAEDASALKNESSLIAGWAQSLVSAFVQIEEGIAHNLLEGFS